MELNNTWNTWDAKCLNAVMRVPEMAEIRVGIYDDKEKFYIDELLWRNVTDENVKYKNVHRFGFHHPSGKYFEIDLKYKDFIFNMEFASENDRFVYKISPQLEVPHIKFHVTGLFRWNAEGTAGREGNTLKLESPYQSYKVEVLGEIDSSTPINSSHPGVMLNSGKPFYIRCNNSMNETQMDSFLEQKRKECMKELATGSGILGDSPQAIIKGVAWNMIYEPVKNRFCTPVSRAWCVQNGSSFGSYVLFEWDTFFAGLMSGIQDKELAYSQVSSIFDEMTKAGMLPNFGAQRGSSIDRSQPPVGAYCVLKLYRQFGEKEFIQKYFDRLVTWNSWWMKHRDGNGDGLLEWGSDPAVKGEQAYDKTNNLVAALLESGLDNSPMYDNVGYDLEAHTMELADVGLNSLYAMDCWAVSELAREIGRDDVAERKMTEYENIKELINRELWNENAGIYCNKHWNGTFNLRLSPTNFYPLIAGVATQDRARRMIEEHLLNEQEFWGEYVIPSIARNDEAFEDNNYWRGRIWGPMNFLVSEGIKRYGFNETAYSFSRKSLDLFMKEWREENHIHENYNTITGDGDDKTNADPAYTWGGLLAYTAIGEVAEAQPWSAIRFGNLSGEKAEILNYPIENDRYDVFNGSKLIVKKNGEFFIETTMPVIITGFKVNEGSIRFTLEYELEGELVLTVKDSIDKIIIVSKGQTQEFEIKAGSKSVTFVAGRNGITL